MREKEKKGMQHKDWGRESPRVRHICLALDIKNNENRTDVSYGRGRRLSRGEITNRSVCPLFVLNLFILFERKKCEHHVAAYKTEKKRRNINTALDGYTMWACCNGDAGDELKKVKPNIVLQHWNLQQDAATGIHVLPLVIQKGRETHRETVRERERREREERERPFAVKSHVTEPKWHHSAIIRYNGQQQETAILYLIEK